MKIIMNGMQTARNKNPNSYSINERNEERPREREEAQKKSSDRCKWINIYSVPPVIFFLFTSFALLLHFGTVSQVFIG